MFDWKSIIKSIAPMIGTALGGPFGGAATKILLNVLDPEGKTNANDDSQVSKVVADAMGNLEKVAAIQQAEQQFKLQMAQLGFENERALDDIAFKDRDSARNREIQIRDHTPAIGFYLITAGFFGLLAMMLWHIIPASNERILDVMTGALGTAWIGAVQYYYGTTRSSGLKDQMLFNSTPTDGSQK